MKAYSPDLRKKIIDAYENHEGSYRTLARQFGVSVSFIQNLIKQYKTTGKIEPKPHKGGALPKLTRQQTTLVRQLVAKDSDATLVQLCDLFYQNTRIQISPSTMSRLLKR